MVKEELDDVLREKLHNLQRGVRSVVYNVFEQKTLDKLLKDIVEETLVTHMAKFSDTDEVDKALSQRLLTSTFLQRLLQLLFGVNWTQK